MQNNACVCNFNTPESQTAKHTRQIGFMDTNAELQNNVDAFTDTAERGYLMCCRGEASPLAGGKAGRKRRGSESLI